MVFACVAIIDQNNAPLYVKHLGDQADLRFSYLVHTSLDIINEKLDSPEMYLGLLAPAEDFNIYGYLTNTKVKLVAVLDDLDASPKMKNFFRRLHAVFIDQVCNPFYVPNTPIESKKLDAAVQNLISTF